MEQIYAFTYKRNPRASWTTGSLWAKDLHEAARKAKSALHEAFPDHVKGKLFQASNPKSNVTMLPVKDPDGDGYLTPAMALKRERQRMGVRT